MFSLQSIFIFISFLVALPVHESAHALTAKLLGDPTGERLSRISLNPLNHLDPTGTILLIFAGFGWGKPVPVNTNNFKDPQLYNALTALAGPLSNIMLALALFPIYKYAPLPTLLHYFLYVFIGTNLMLAVFNLLPIPPLDGGHVIELIVPESLMPLWRKIQEVSPFILLGLFILESFGKVPIFTYLVRIGVDYLFKTFEAIT